jgi:hypothetical protein
MKPRQTSNMSTGNECPWLLARALVSLVVGVLKQTPLGEENIFFLFSLSFL